MTVTRLPDGINNASLPSVFEDMGQLDPSKFHNYFNDFDTFDTAEWVITTIEAGSGSASEAIQDEDGGILKITNDDADDDSDFLQLAQETFRFVAGKKLFFKSRFKVSGVVESAFVIGLQIKDTTPLEATDGVFFRKNDGATTFNFRSEKNNDSTGTFINTLAITDDTYLDVGFFYNGVDKISCFVDNTFQGSIGVTNLPDDEDLTISFGVENGEAVIKTMSIDYIHIAKER